MISHKNLISVIIPYYNSRFDYFKLAVESVLSQSYKNWEVIIVNDGSHTENVKLLEGFLNSLNDKRFILIHLDNNYGPACARNKGIEVSRGNIITFLDTDDMHFPWYYEEINDFFLNNPEYLIIASPSYKYIKTKQGKNIFLGNYETRIIQEPHTVAFHGFRFPKILSNEEQETYDLLAKKTAQKLFINNTPRLAVKKEVFQKINFDPQFRTGEDSDFCFQILNNENILTKTWITLDPYYLHRIFSSKSRLTQNSLLVFENITKLKNKYNDNISVASKSLWQLERRDEWKFDSIIYNHLKGQPLIKTIKDTLSLSPSKKGKIKCLVKLLKLIIKYQLITQLIGIDYREYKIPKSENINKTKDIEVLFTKYLQSTENNGNRTCGTKIYETIFN